MAEETRKAVGDKATLDSIIHMPITKSVIPTLFGWPASGGVWVLKLRSEEEWKEYNQLPITGDMEIHCSNLKKFGANFYNDPNDSEDARQALSK